MKLPSQHSGSAFPWEIKNGYWTSPLNSVLGTWPVSASVKQVHHGHTDAMARTDAQNRMRIACDQAATRPALPENH
ncbi:hypothetical protein [Noviherbaspirillum sp. Root189]|uniref:hypothetical protein n=1 Tax=Noviherbaspirillum sp. Root189 TaxID=1736487 RepID=UPI00070B2AF4|nr:hypothetical protein [Noviherbaspirillum sp. Root189]KRB89917.1 hypothetical protein ASE07_17415 [Noviherbaspirillum sp. Root189]